MVVDGEIKHVFVDEVDGSFELEPLDANAITLWTVIPYYNSGITTMGKISCARMNLSKVLRNCKKIAKYEGSKNYSTDIDKNTRRIEPELQISIPENVPEGRDPITIQEEAMDTEQKIRDAYDRMNRMASKDSGIIFLVRCDGRIPRELVATIETIGKGTGKTVKCYLNEIFLEPFESTETPFEFLKEINSVLITDTVSIDGFEWPNVIVYLCGRNDSEHSIVPMACMTNTSCFTRSTTNLIVVDDK